MAKVIHIIDTLEPGGAQAIVLSIVRRIPGQKVLAISGKGVFASRILKEGVPCQALAPSRLLFPLALVRLVPVVLRARNRWIVNAHLDFATLALCIMRRLLPFRLVVTVHALQAQWPRWYVPLFKRLIGAADHVVVEDHVSLAEVLACGVPADRVSLVPIGTDALDETPPPPSIDLRAELGLEPGRPLILNIARMTRGKGQADLLRALAAMRRKDAVAVIVGDGPERPRLDSLAAELGLRDRVFFLGRRTDLHNLYPHASLLAMPCLDESMGVVIYEALAHRLPVVAYDSGSIGEVIKHGHNGFLVPADPAGLARQMDALLDTPPYLDFSRNDEFSGRTMASRYAGVYERLAGAVAGPEPATPRDR